ncbi:hypothetical protein [Novosphingobium album (ex Liu et al. 2023)]|uniref:DUF3298 domain-containing protein n=1 Tax=Novosphingobium album (ex Liu et al. 2023) TaxID=3031130 RepID=A0ABT5WKI1_9SPHN|nr:hypothetical protein [Novosphingobium album (ex Liu et al. 2023)]MDE8650414.1 hypothetical protein [Novosphingobium album (ex Liu et al. 2023)]
MRRTPPALAILAVLAAPAGAAEPSAPAWAGVWQGTIGNLPVRVCLQASPGGYSNGSYYYLSRKRPIVLEREDDGNWSERDGGDVTGHWNLAARTTDSLAGDWRQGARRLPIALTRMAFSQADDRPCASDAYSAPRVVPARVLRRPARLGAFAYTELTYDVGPNFEDVSIVSFAYPESEPGDRAINAALRFDPALRDGDADYLGCFEGALGSLGVDGDFQAARVPKLAKRDFLVVQESFGGSCGGAHPDYGYEWRVWDRRDGHEIDLAGWLTDKAIAERGEGKGARRITPALRALAMRHMAITDAECREAVAREDYWFLGLAENGFLMTPALPHVVVACADDALVPFSALAAFLAPAGRQGLARLRGAR